MNKRIQYTCIIIIIGLLFLISACQISRTKTLPIQNEIEKTETLYSQDKMLHLKQVVEYYDADGNPLPRYIELYAAQDKMTAFELDADGNVVQVIQDTKKKHLSYDLTSLKAVEYKTSQIISLNLLKFPNNKDSSIKDEGTYQYIERKCHSYTISNGKEDDDVYLYIDNKTGYVLFCDAPMFCIKTASIEILPYDSGYFAIPDDLIYE